MESRWRSSTYISVARHTFAFSRRVRPSLASSFCPCRNKGAGKAGRRRHPRSVRHKMHTGWTTGSAERPAFPARWFTAYFVLSPGSDALLPPSPCGWLMRLPGWAAHITTGLDAQTPGVRTTRLGRPRTSSLGLRALACTHARSHAKTLSASCRARDGGRSRRKPPCNSDQARRRRVHRCQSRGS